MITGESQFINVLNKGESVELHELLGLDELDVVKGYFEVPFFFSGNAMYAPTKKWKTGKGGKKYLGTTLRRVDEVGELKDVIKETVTPIDPILLKSVTLSKISAVLCAPREYFLTKGNKPQKVDATNLWKSLEDGIVEATGLDDSYHEQIKISKFISDEQLFEVYYEITLYGRL